MVVRVLIAAAAAGTAGCYAPAIEDCYFTCTPNQPECPDDMTCTDGYCRPPGASGSCGCPLPPAGCVGTFPIGDGCGTTCAAAASWSSAIAQCDDGLWHLAILEPQSEFGDVPTPSMALWVGFSWTAGGWTWFDGSLVDSAAFGGPVPTGTPGICGAVAYLTSPGVNGAVIASCGDAKPYVCEYP